MVKSETRRDAEILVRNPSPRLFGEKFRDSKKVKKKTRKNETSRLIKNVSEISRSCQNFPRLTFFEVPFATPTSAFSNSHDLFTGRQKKGLRTFNMMYDLWRKNTNLKYNLKHTSLPLSAVLKIILTNLCPAHFHFSFLPRFKRSLQGTATFGTFWVQCQDFCPNQNRYRNEN